MIATLTLAGVGFGVLAALSAGVGDFLGGVATRRSSAWGATAVTWLGQFPLVVGLAFLLEGGLDSAAVVPGMAAGLAGAAGLVLLYNGIARGDVAIVAATSGVAASVFAALYDLVTGVALPAPAWIGIVLALPAIALVAGGTGEAVTVSLRALGNGLGAGASFGLMYLLIGATGGESGDPSVVAVAAGCGGLALLMTAPLVPGPVMPRGGALGISLVASVLAGAHLVALVFAVERGSVSTGTVLAAQYPAFTVLMAAIVWRQRPTRLQVAGLILALVAVGMIARGAS